MPELEKEFMGKGKSRMQTYLILGILLIGGLLVINLAISSPETAKNGIKNIAGLPSWAFPVLLLVIGFVIFWFGLKLETDWPEAIGSLMIATAVAMTEVMVGWQKFAVAGIFILPYILPVLVFFILLFYGMQKSR
jgi:hypothetical protein